MNFIKAAIATVLSATAIALVAPEAEAMTYNQGKADAITLAGVMLDAIGLPQLNVNLSDSTAAELFHVERLKNLEKIAGTRCENLRFKGQLLSKDDAAERVKQGTIESINTIDRTDPLAGSYAQGRAIMFAFIAISEYEQCPDRFLF
jgi:hypothetical protein